MVRVATAMFNMKESVFISFAAKSAMPTNSSSTQKSMINLEYFIIVIL
nr:hypothetical protein [Ornithobacterium rhinotracheale]